MQVIILAGGLGTRLSEETVNIPKPMVRIGQDPVIVHLIKYYASYGHTDFVIVLGYKSDIIKEYFSNFNSGKSSTDVDFSKQTTIIKPLTKNWQITLINTGSDTGTGGSLLALREVLDENFMMTYGDGLSDVDLNNLESTHKKGGGRMATVTAVRPPSRFGSLEIENGRVLKFREKLPEEAGWINGGFFLLNKSICDYISDQSEMFERKPLEMIADAKRIN